MFEDYYQTTYHFTIGEPHNGRVASNTMFLTHVLVLCAVHLDRTSKINLNGYFLLLTYASLKTDITLVTQNRRMYIDVTDG